MNQQSYSPKNNVHLFLPWFLLHIIGTPLLLFPFIFFGHIGFLCYWVGMGMFQGVLLAGTDADADDVFLSRWVGASALGGLICVCIVTIAGWFADIRNGFLNAALLWIVLNVLVASIQALAIRRYVAHAWLWVAASLGVGVIHVVGSIAAFVGGLPAGLIALLLSGALSSCTIDLLLSSYTKKVVEHS